MPSVLMSLYAKMTDMSSTGHERIVLTRDGDGEWWVARDTVAEVTSQGRTRQEALENLDEAVAIVKGDGRTPTDEELRELGIDPEDNRKGRGELPDVLQ